MSVQVAEFLMKLRERAPQPPVSDVGELQEVFRHDRFLSASESGKRDIMLGSSAAKYSSEFDYPWDAYFGEDLAPHLRGREILDLGCFTGGRSAAWFERYQLRKLSGIDVDQVYIDAATQFAALKNINANYKVAVGEQLPFENETFDAVLSFDVFEHVQDVRNTLHECWRVLKPNGRLYVVFPSYFQPIEHHLDLVTGTPFIHYFFGRETLIRAYSNILDERGQDAYWYKRAKSEPEPWERCNTINGTTLRQFQRYLDDERWHIVAQSRKPIGSIGRNVSKKKWPLLVSRLFSPLTFVPGLQEIFLHRITFVLEKKP